MRLPTRQDTRASLPGHLGTLRVGRTAADPFVRVREGDLVLVDAVDLDPETARDLLAHHPHAVLNTRAFISGRLPNRGPVLLAKGGVALLEITSSDAKLLTDGRSVRLHESTVYDDGHPGVVLLEGHRLDEAEIASRMEQARTGLATQLDSFTHGVSQCLRDEGELFLHGSGLPALRTDLAGRAVVVVGPTTERAELQRLRRYVREQRPVLVGVDEGADLLLQLRLSPDVVVLGEKVARSLGDDEPRLSERVVRRARDVVVATSRDDSKHGVSSARLDRLGVRPETVRTTAEGIDIALLLARKGGASLVIAAGGGADLEQLVDSRSADRASSYLTRVRLGSTLVEASAVPQLYSGRVRLWYLLAILLVAILALGFAVNVTPRGHAWIDHTWHSVRR